MTKKRKVVSIAGLFFLIALFIPLVAAKEDFQAYGKKRMTACSCSTGTYNLSLINTGDTSSAYSLSSGEEWLSPYSNEFALKPGQRINIPITLTAPCIDSNQTIQGSILISTKSGLTKELGQEFLFNAGCYDYTLSKGKLVNYEFSGSNIPATVHDDSYSLCEDEKAIIPMFLVNKAIYENSYTSFLKGNSPLWASLNVDQFDLNGKSSGAFFLSLEPTQNSSGIYEFFVRTESSFGRLKKEEKISLNISQCHSLNFEIRKEEELLCYGDKSSYQLILNNDADRAEIVRFLVEGPKWAKLSKNNVLLAPKSAESLTINMMPENNSTSSDMIITAIVEGTSLNISKQIDIEIASIEECYSSSLSIPDTITNQHSIDYKSFKIMNNGIKKSDYSLSVDGPSWVSVEPSNLTLNPSQSFNAVLKIAPLQDTPDGIYDFVLKSKSGENHSEKKFTITLKKKNADLVWLGNFYKYNKYYVYALISLLIVLFLFREKIKEALSSKYRLKKKRLRALEKAREARRLKSKNIQ